MAIYRMVNTVQHYAWGSSSMLSALRAAVDPLKAGAADASDGREAELWMGSHPRGPSAVVLADGGTAGLDELIGGAPETVVGAAALNLLPDGAAPGLPFLFKILTAEKGLSIQAHPSRRQAAEGYEREDRAGIALDAPHRNYRDRNHKPELICALGDFWGLRGFRPLDELVDEMVRWSRHFVDGALDALRGRIEGLAAEPSWERWRAVFLEVLRVGSSPEERSRLVAALGRYGASHSVAHGGANRDDRYWWVGELMRQFPNDPGAAAPLYLNLVHLRRAQAMYLEAGVLHAYLYGAGVEIMANSDNVLRSGCTVKHVDPDELARALIFEGAPAVRLSGEGEAYRYRTAAQEFELTRLTAPGGVGAAASYPLTKTEGPMVVLAVGGEVVVEATGRDRESESIALVPTESAFIDHATPAVLVTPARGATAFIAALPGAVNVPAPGGVGDA